MLELDFRLHLQAMDGQPGLVDHQDAAGAATAVRTAKGLLVMGEICKESFPSTV